MRPHVDSGRDLPIDLFLSHFQQARLFRLSPSRVDPKEDVPLLQMVLAALEEAVVFCSAADFVFRDL